MEIELVLVASVAVLSLVVAAFYSWRLSKRDAGGKEMREIASAIRLGAMTYLKRQYLVIAAFAIVIAFLLFFLVGLPTAIAFAVGAACSAAIGFIGLNNSTKANVRTAQAARESLKGALSVAFSSGLVTSLSAVGLGLLGIIGVYAYFAAASGLNEATSILFGFGMGASTIALFARVGGGIFTKAADVGADLVGKFEAGIPEDDPRNPAVIADNVGDNVGDVAGVSADLFESYVGAIIAAMALGALTIGLKGVLLPLMLAGSGVIACLLGSLFLHTSPRVEKALRNVSLIGTLFAVTFAFVITNFWFGGASVFYAVAVGMGVGIALSFTAEYYTSTSFAPARRIAESATTGPATVVLNGFSVGLQSTAPSIILICVGTWVAFQAAGVYGIGLAAVGMLSTLGLSLAADAYGPVSDNAGGIVEMARLPRKVRARTDELDAAGNTTKAIGKGFAVGSAALTALAFYTVYAGVSGLQFINLMDPLVVMGLLIGGALAFLFASLTIKAVEKTAFELVNEVRRQFKESPGILKGKKKPDYAKCVDIAALAALKQMSTPALIAVLAPILVGVLFGKAALGGLLAGALVAGVLLGVLMANSGGAWDNAKKFIEAGAYGGKGSYAHKASIIGDTIGDPFKDTAGPSMNILIKLMGIIALVFAGLFA